MTSVNILVHDQHIRHWHYFQSPTAVIAANDISEVVQALEEADRLVNEQNQWAVGFVSYEAGPAFDPAMQTHPPARLPLVWIGLFDTPRSTSPPPSDPPQPLHWQPSLDPAAYAVAIDHIKTNIAAGNTYQVNYTMRLQAPFTGDAFSLFSAMSNGQQCGYSAFIETEAFAICSASPELFFELNGNRLLSRPMKGTAPRGRSSAEDEAQIAWLKDSEKNRAENVMIVDMVRNDMGRIANTGTVSVPRLFDVERYPSVLQMTSTVECETDASLPEIFGALFPCASITGAPKIRTMSLIRELENSPRGLYTGAIGFWTPDRRAQFNVAIRTAVIDKNKNAASYGIGSGIVWDSRADDEYDECLLKARVLSTPTRPAFALLESLRWEKSSGFVLLDRHCARLSASAEYFQIPFQEKRLRKILSQASRDWGAGVHKIRVLVNKDGRIQVEAAWIDTGWFSFTPPYIEGEISYGVLAADPVDEQDIFLFHKTTHRQVYEAAQRAHPGLSHVLLWNRSGELTEFTTANLVIKRNGKYLTPPVRSGLLPGTFREEILARRIVEEQTLIKEDLAAAEMIWAVNSVRGWQQVVFPSA